MELVFKTGKIFLAIFVLAGLIFAGTQSVDVLAGWAMGLLGVINLIVIAVDVFGKTPIQK